MPAKRFLFRKSLPDKKRGRFEFYGARRNGGTAGKRLRLESVPRKADSRENRAHNDPLSRERGF